MRGLLVVAACLGLGAPPALADAFTFRWPVPARVSVTERVLKRGVSATLRYEVTLAPARDGQRLALRLSRVQLLEIGGRDPRAAPARRQLEGALKTASALPTILVSKEGVFEDIADLPAMIERISAGSSTPPEQRRAMANMMKSPEMVPLLKQRAADFWNLWVGLWAGTRLVPGRTVEFTQEVPLPDGSVIERPLRVTHHGPSGPPGHVRLSFDSTLEGGASTRSVQAFLDGLLQQLAGAAGEPIPRDMVERVEMSAGGEVVTDPETLRPVAARSHQRFVLKVKGHPPRGDLETREYTFTWGRPPGRGR